MTIAGFKFFYILFTNYFCDINGFLCYIEGDEVYNSFRIIDSEFSHIHKPRDIHLKPILYSIE